MRKSTVKTSEKKYSQNECSSPSCWYFFIAIFLDFLSISGWCVGEGGLGSGLGGRGTQGTERVGKHGLHSKRVKMRTTLETSEDENYTRNEWRWELHSKRVKMKTTLETSENEYLNGYSAFFIISFISLPFCLVNFLRVASAYKRVETETRGTKLHPKRVELKTTLKTSEIKNYTQNEWIWKLHPKRVKLNYTCVLGQWSINGWLKCTLAIM